MSTMVSRAAGRLGRRGFLGLALAGLLALGLAQGLAEAEEKLKVAAIFSTPIEEPWVNQIHEALLRRRKNSASSINGPKACPRPTMPAYCASSLATATS